MQRCTGVTADESVLQLVLCVLFQFLIGYNRGLIVLWDSKENNAEQTYNATQVRHTWSCGW